MSSGSLTHTESSRGSLPCIRCARLRVLSPLTVRHFRSSPHFSSTEKDLRCMRPSSAPLSLAELPFTRHSMTISMAHRGVGKSRTTQVRRGSQASKVDENVPYIPYFLMHIAARHSLYSRGRARPRQRLRAPSCSLSAATAPRSCSSDPSSGWPGTTAQQEAGLAATLARPALLPLLLRAKTAPRHRMSNESKSAADGLRMPAHPYQCQPRDDTVGQGGGRHGKRHLQHSCGSACSNSERPAAGDELRKEARSRDARDRGGHGPGRRRRNRGRGG